MAAKNIHCRPCCFAAHSLNHNISSATCYRHSAPIYYYIINTEQMQIQIVFFRILCYCNRPESPCQSTFFRAFCKGDHGGFFLFIFCSLSCFWCVGHRYKFCIKSGSLSKIIPSRDNHSPMNILSRLREFSKSTTGFGVALWLRLIYYVWDFIKRNRFGTHNANRGAQRVYLRQNEVGCRSVLASVSISQWRVVELNAPIVSTRGKPTVACRHSTDGNAPSFNSFWASA